MASTLMIPIPFRTSTDVCKNKTTHMLLKAMEDGGEKLIVASKISHVSTFHTAPETFNISGRFGIS